MLIDISITNFRSFKDTATFSMESGYRLRKWKDSNTFSNIHHPELLKSSFIFGPNANGKTNILKAFQLIQFLLNNPAKSNDDHLMTDTFGHNKQSTTFEINFLTNNKKFRYYLNYNSDEVISEKLEYDGSIVLERNRQSFDIIPEILTPVKETFRKNQLLLYLAQSYNFEPAQTAYSWITKDVLYVNSTNNISDKLLREFQNSESLQNRLLNFIQAADFSIADFEIVESKEGFKITIDHETMETQIVDKPVKLLLKHATDSGHFTLPFSQESEGTQIFISLALQLIFNSAKGKLLLIDEFESSLHQALTLSLMEIFNNTKQKNQFVITTHDLDLMDNNLRVDQIWFVEKNRFGETDLYSLLDFDTPNLKRNDFGFKKRYIAGMFGATQIINQNRLMENVFGGE